MRPTEMLYQLVTTYMSSPGRVSKAKPKSDFVISGLRAATAANLSTRRKILSDVSDVLNCNANELDFLFDRIPDSISPAGRCEVSLPDFREELLSVAE